MFVIKMINIFLHFTTKTFVTLIPNYEIFVLVESITDWSIINILEFWNSMPKSSTDYSFLLPRFPFFKIDSWDENEILKVCWNVAFSASFYINFFTTKKNVFQSIFSCTPSCSSLFPSPLAPVLFFYEVIKVPSFVIYFLRFYILYIALVIILK